MSGWKPDPIAEALGDAWASIDGRVERFRAGKLVPEDYEAHGGSYHGYLADAEEMITRLATRGYKIVKISKSRSRIRSAKHGQFASKDDADASPDTHIRETVR